MPKPRRPMLPLMPLLPLLLLAPFATAARSTAAQEPKSPPAAAAQADQEEPLEVKGDVQKPVKISGAAPLCKPFPQEPTVVKGVIDRQGSFSQLQILRPRPHRADYADCILKTLGSWKFRPAMKNGAPVSVKYTLTIEHLRS